MIQGKRNNRKMGFYNQNYYKIKVLEGFDLILKHRNIIQKKKKWLIFFNFHPTLTADNSGLKPSKLKNYHIFGMPRTSAF